MEILIIVIIVGYLIYYNSEKQKKSSLLVKKAQHLDKKYDSEIRINTHYTQQIEKLSKLVNESFLLGIIKKLIELDPERYNSIVKNKENTDASLRAWIEESKDRKLVSVWEIKKLHDGMLKKLDEVRNLQQSYVAGYLEQSSGWKIQLDLDAITSILMSTENFYKIVNEKKYLNLEKMNLKDFVKEYSKVVKKIEDAIIEINDRQFEIT
ncbi:MAG: hypothetical protein HN981_02490 [Candidatus Pacebacteria bacterium]|jgi:hypothetical protein|nr:hypothetical protein [Candidatus Paceibacterota bacterium]MBT6921238.1 hypothetical protein [Candidatus Paceibacterota bacterium]